MASVLKVDKLDPQSGTALEIGTSGDTISIPSGATLDISASTLTPPATMPASSGVNLTALNATQLTSGTIPDARFTTLPAVSGANLTSLTAGNLSSGTVPTARLGSGTASSSVFLAGDSSWIAAGGGITMADAWRTTLSQVIETGEEILSDDNGTGWSRVNSDGYGTIGSAMTEAADGAFTFPATGIYWINMSVQLQKNGDSRYNDIRLYTTGDDFSSSMWASMGRMFITQSDSNTTVGEAHTDFIFDVTATSTHKIKFSVYAASGDLIVGSDGGLTQSGFTVIRLGDT